MDLKQHLDDTDLKIDMSPMIDMVFLLLIYFMVTASLIRKEGDISFILPASVPPSKIINVPVEALIFILEDGTVEMDGLRCSPTDYVLDELAILVGGLKEIADTQQSPFSVTLTPHEDSYHERVIDVMDACAAVGVKNLAFGKATM